MKEFFRMTWTKFLVAVFFITWQFFYSYQGVRLDFLSQTGEYLLRGLGLVQWNNYFIRNGSMLFVWIVVAVIIYFMIIVSQKISQVAHNRKIKQTYLNQPVENYEHLLEDNQKKFVHEAKEHLWWLGAVFVFILTLFFLSDFIEKFRFNTVDALLWDMQEAGQAVDFNSPLILVVSFLLTSPIWYTVSGTVLWLWGKERSSAIEEEIADEHFAVEVDTSENEDEEEQG